MRKKNTETETMPNFHKPSLRRLKMLVMLVVCTLPGIECYFIILFFVSSYSYFYCFVPILLKLGHFVHYITYRM